MEVRVADISGFQATVEIEPSSTITDLRATVARQFPFDPTNCLVCHEGKELMDSDEGGSPQPRRRGRVARWLRPGERIARAAFGSGDPGLLEEDGSEEEASPTESAFDFGAIFTSLTEAELQMVLRLIALGFALDTVIQVFEVCGRDENATQACLMSGGFL
jgi:hypothetical protein